MPLEALKVDYQSYLKLHSLLDLPDTEFYETIERYSRDEHEFTNTLEFHNHSEERQAELFLANLHQFNSSYNYNNNKFNRLFSSVVANRIVKLENIPAELSSEQRDVIRNDIINVMKLRTFILNKQNSIAVLKGVKGLDNYRQSSTNRFLEESIKNAIPKIIRPLFDSSNKGNISELLERYRIITIRLLLLHTAHIEERGLNASCILSCFLKNDTFAENEAAVEAAIGECLRNFISIFPMLRIDNSSGSNIRSIVDKTNSWIIKLMLPILTNLYGLLITPQKYESFISPASEFTTRSSKSNYGKSSSASRRVGTFTKKRKKFSSSPKGSSSSHDLMEEAKRFLRSGGNKTKRYTDECFKHYWVRPDLEIRWNSSIADPEYLSHEVMVIPIEVKFVQGPFISGPFDIAGDKKGMKRDLSEDPRLRAQKEMVSQSLTQMWFTGGIMSVLSNLNSTVVLIPASDPELEQYHLIQLNCSSDAFYLMNLLSLLFGELCFQETLRLGENLGSNEIDKDLVLSLRKESVFLRKGTVGRDRKIARFRDLHRQKLQYELSNTYQARLLSEVQTTFNQVVFPGILKIVHEEHELDEKIRITKELVHSHVKTIINSNCLKVPHDLLLVESPFKEGDAPDMVDISELLKEGMTILHAEDIKVIRCMEGYSFPSNRHLNTVFLGQWPHFTNTSGATSKESVFAPHSKTSCPNVFKIFDLSRISIIGKVYFNAYPRDFKLKFSPLNNVFISWKLFIKELVALKRLKGLGVAPEIVRYGYLKRRVSPKPNEILDQKIVNGQTLAGEIGANRLIFCEGWFIEMEQVVQDIDFRNQAIAIDSIAAPSSSKSHQDLASLKKELWLQSYKNLHQIHERNIIHGDISSRNIKLKKTGAIFFDFGLSTITSKGPNDMMSPRNYNHSSADGDLQELKPVSATSEGTFSNAASALIESKILILADNISNIQGWFSADSEGCIPSIASSEMNEELVEALKREDRARLADYLTIEVGTCEELGLDLSEFL